MLALFSVTDKNPNDPAGGGGCMCSPVKTDQCRPPYCVFHAAEMLAPRSPMAVMSLACAQRFVTAVEPANKPAPAKPAPRPGRKVAL